MNKSDLCNLMDFIPVIDEEDFNDIHNWKMRHYKVLWYYSGLCGLSFFQRCKIMLSVWCSAKFTKRKR